MTVMISEKELSKIPRIRGTKTWKPVHHTRVVSEIDAAADRLGLEIVSKRYEVSDDGKDMFATWQLLPDKVTGVKDSTMIGFRNSMKKRFSLGLVAGNNVLVCSNMCFWGDFCENRKHTSGLTAEALYLFVDRAVEHIVSGSEKFRKWFEGLNALALPETTKKLMVYDMMDRGILTPGHWKKFHEAYEEELKDNRFGGNESFAHLHGATTRVLREMSLDQVQVRSRLLNDLIGDRLEAEELVLAA